MAAPTWVASGSIVQTTSGTSFSVSPPSHATGDLLVIVATVYNTITLATPSGWTLLADSGQWGGGRESYVFYKLAASGSEPAVTLTASGSGFKDGQMICFRGINLSTPIDAAAIWGTAVSTASVPVPAITTVTNDALMVSIGVDLGSNGSSWSAAPAGVTIRSTTASLNLASFVVGTETKTTAGTEATDNYTHPGTNARVVVFAIRPIILAAPVANFTGTPLTGTAPLSVAFTDSTTNTPTSWAWDFGDGATSTSQNPTHTYSVGGTYTVTLVATGAGGTDTKTRTGYVVVSNPSGTMSRIRYGTGLGVTDEGSGVIRVDASVLAIDAQTASYTLVLADAGKLVSISNASANTLTVPAYASVAFPVGTILRIRQAGAGQTTVAGAGGVTVNARGGALKLAGQYAHATLVKVATDTWELSGDITT